MASRYRRHRGLLVLLAACALAPGAGAQEAWRLERLLDAAWTGHPAVLGKRAGVQAARGDLEGTLRLICERVHGYGEVPVNRSSR